MAEITSRSLPCAASSQSLRCSALSYVLTQLELHWGVCPRAPRAQVRLGQDVWERQGHRIRWQDQAWKTPKHGLAQTVAPGDTGVWTSGTELSGVNRGPWAPSSASLATPKKDGSCHRKALALERPLCMPVSALLPSPTHHDSTGKASTLGPGSSSSMSKEISFPEDGGCMIRSLPLVPIRGSLR